MTINGTNESDSEVLWTWERMLERTKPYCECYDYYCEMLKMHITGWQMSKLALGDILYYTCLQ
jgi:hypothetical protein